MKKILSFSILLLVAVLFSNVLSAQELKKTETFYADGKVKELYQADAKGLKQGSYTLFYPNGNLQLLIEFKNGVKNGKFTSWHSNAKIKEESNYTDNKRIGKYTAYDELGNVIESAK